MRERHLFGDSLIVDMHRIILEYRVTIDDKPCFNKRMGYTIDDKNTTAILIRELRTQRRWTQQQLAARAGVSFSFVNQVERGKTTVRLDAVNKLLKVFGYAMAPRELSFVEKEAAQPVSLSERSNDAPSAESRATIRSRNDWAFYK